MRVMMNKRSLAFAEGLVVWEFRRRYLQLMRRNEGLAMYCELGADAVARLSFAGVRRLRDMLWSEREALRDLEDHRAADSLTSALRDIDTRIQILDDMLR